MTKQKKGASNSRKEIKSRVLEAFRDHPGHEFNYKRIAKQLNLKKEALKKACAHFDGRIK